MSVARRRMEADCGKAGLRALAIGLRPVVFASSTLYCDTRTSAERISGGCAEARKAACYIR
jgi:hypothetical protein